VTRRAQALTLLELLVAGVLLGTVLIVLIQAVTLATQIASQSHRESVALQLIETLLARLEAGELAVGTDATGDFIEEGFAGYRWSLTNEPSGELVKVVVSVAWDTGYGERALAISGLFAPAASESSSEEPF
jgi:type II secretory pathway pseudopilin PulG